jgi:hypothetical protein
MNTAQDLAYRVASAINLGSKRAPAEFGPFIVAIDGGDAVVQTAESHASFATDLQAAIKASAMAEAVVVLLDVSHVAGSSQTQAMFQAFISSLSAPRDARKKTLLGYLQAIPWSQALAAAMFKRIQSIAVGAKWILVVPAAPSLSEHRSREFVEAALYLAQATDAQSVVFCEVMPELRSHRFCRVPANVQGLPEFLDAVRARIGHLTSQQAEHSGGILSKLFAFLSPEERTRLPVDEDRWVAFIAQCSYPNLRHVDEILVHLSLATERVRRWSKEQAQRRAQPLGAFFEAERKDLLARAWFIAILYAVHPEEVNKARHSLSGAFALFGSQFRALAGKRQLVALGGMTARQADEQLASLFQRAMSAVSKLKTRSSMSEQSLVTRFPSASSLRRHIDWQFGALALEEAGLPTWEEWIDGSLRKRIHALASGINVDALDFVNLGLRETGFPEALLERAAWILEMIELERPSRVAAKTEATEHAMPRNLQELLDKAGRLVSKALEFSDATMRFEALIVRSRYLALSGSPDDARECVLTARQIFAGTGAHPVPQALLADLAEAYVDEVAGIVERAPPLYVATAKAAARANVDEVLWRAVYGAMRCDLAQVQPVDGRGSTHLAQIMLRAQVLLQVQTSRSPRLVDLADTSRTTLFVSYRRESRDIAARLVDDIKLKVGDEAAIRAWFDQRIEHEVEDFAPKIQKNLTECRAALFIVSRQFWESCYCCCEMWFMASRSGMSALQIPMFWVVVDDEASVDQDSSSEETFERLLKSAVDATNPGSAGALLHFLNDVARDRVLNLGISVVPHALKASRSAVDGGNLRWIDSEARVGQVEDTLIKCMRELAMP